MRFEEIKYVLIPWFSKPKDPLYGFYRDGEWFTEEDNRKRYVRRINILSLFKWVWVLILSSIIGGFIFNALKLDSDETTDPIPQYNLNNYNYGLQKYNNGDYHISLKFFNKCDSLPDSLDILKGIYIEKCEFILDSIKYVSDSLFVIKSDSLRKISEDKFNNSKAGRIYKLHPEWSKDDCERLSQNYIWVGMNIDMVVYLRGKPDKINISNYGNGNRYQYIWRNYNISYFYCNSNGIVSSYH